MTHCGSRWSKCCALRDFLFDHLVGEGEHVRRQLNTEKLCSSKIDDELEPRWLRPRVFATEGAHEIRHVGMALRELLENSRAVTAAPCAAAPASSTRRAEDLVFLNNRLNAASYAGFRAGQCKPCDTQLPSASA